VEACPHQPVDGLEQCHDPSRRHRGALVRRGSGLGRVRIVGCRPEEWTAAASNDRQPEEHVPWGPAGLAARTLPRSSTARPPGGADK